MPQKDWYFTELKIQRQANAMIVSHKYQFIFIKTLKTAGTSLEVFLSNLCGEDDIITPIYPPEQSHVPRNYHGIWNPGPELIENRGHGIKRTMRNLYERRKFYNHIPAKIARHRLPKDIWNNYLKFCIERNPWDKTLSHFHMVKERSDVELTFHEYLSAGKFCFNSPIYLDNSDNVLVDRIVKYESLSSDLSDIFSDLGIPYDGVLGVRAKSGHRKDKRPYQEVYTDSSRKIIADAFETEIMLHDYIF